MNEADNSPRSTCNPKVGDEIAGFRLTARLGAGTDASVFLGDNQSHKSFVLKIGQELTHEAELLSRLRHDGITRFYDLRQSGRLQILVTLGTAGLVLVDLLPVLAESRSHIVPSLPSFREMLEGLRRDRFQAVADARQVLRIDGTESAEWPIVFACNIVMELAAALQYMHDQQVAHCDVKPENIVLNADGSAMLIDFGIGTDFSSAASNTVACGGTLAYMAPEQLAALAGVDSPGTIEPHVVTGVNIASELARADIFALGATLFEMVYGRQPFTIADEGRPVVQIAREALATRMRPPVFPTSPAIPFDLQSILRKCFAPLTTQGDRPVRYRSASELQTDLQDFLSGHRPKFAGTGRSHQRSWLPRLIAATLLLVFTIVAILSGLEQSRLAKVRDSLSAHDRLESIDSATISQIDSVLLQPAGRLETNGQLIARSRLCLRMGLVCMKSDRFEAALKYFTHATVLDHTYGLAWNNIGVVHLRLKQPQPAMTALDRALACHQDEAEVLSNRAIAHAMNNNMERAWVDLNRAVSLESGSDAVQANVHLLKSLSNAD